MTDPSQITANPALPLSEPDETGANLAPAKALEQATKPDPYTAMSILDLCKDFRQEMRKEKETEEWRYRLLASQKNDLYYQGKQKLRKATYSNNWRIEEPKPINFTQNEFQFWTDVNVSKWIASRADYRVSGLNDTEDANAAAQKLEYIAEYYDDRDWTRTDVMDAAKQAMFTGHLVAYVYYDPNYSPRQAYVPVTERQTQKIGQDVYRCADCDDIGQVAPPADANSGPVCASCGSSRVTVTQSPEIEMEAVTGQKAVTVGDVTHQIIPLYNLSWKSRLKLEKSPIVLWEEQMDKSQLEARWPNLTLPRASSEDTGLAIKANLENAGRGGSEKSEKDVLTRMWVEPSRYTKFKLKDDVETVSGKTFKAGQPYTEIFRKGFHVIMLGDLILDLYETDKNLDLCVMEYESVPNGLAQGVDAACEPQRQLNTVKSLINLWMRHNALPPMQYVEGVVDPADLTGDPTKPYGIQAGNLELFPGVTVDNAVTYKQGQPMPPALFEYEQKLRTNLQFAFHATEFSEGLPGVSNTTATGSQISQSLAQGVYSTFLAQFADFRAELIKRKLKKFKRHCWDTRYLPMAGDYGTQEGQYLSAHDVPDDFEITPIADSWAPRTPRQQQQNYMALLGAVGGPLGLAQTPKEILQQMSEVFDVRLDSNDYPAAVRTCRMRIKNAMKLLPALQIANQAIETFTGAPPMGSPQQVSVPQPPVATPMGAVQPPPAQGMVQQPITVAEQLFEAMRPQFNPHENGHEESVNYCRKWLTTDEGIEAPPDVIEFVNRLIQAHVEAIGLENQIKAAVAGAGMPPMMPPAMSSPPGPNMAASATPVGG